MRKNVEPAEVIWSAVKVVDMVELTSGSARAVDLVETLRAVIPVEAVRAVDRVAVAHPVIPVAVVDKSVEAPEVGLTWLLWYKDR